MASNSRAPILKLYPASQTESESVPSGDYLRFEDDTASLLTAAKTYTFENGRRYHGYKEGKYLIPNDEAEQDRMDMMHHCYLMALGGELFIAPVGEDWEPSRILDIGTGSGIWAIDIADRYPEAEVIGVDLSPIQPEWVPPNAKFEVDDIEEPWQYLDNSFDFIHIRHMAGSIYDWPKLYQQAFQALKPGGWIEFQDCCDYFSCDDNSIPATSAFSQYLDNYEKAAIKSGKEFNTVAPGAAGALIDVGCIDVGEKFTKLPLGHWPRGRNEKELGLYWRQNLLDAAEAFALAPFTRVLGWEKAKVDEFLVEVAACMKDSRYHGYSKLYCTYGRKPLE